MKYRVRVKGSSSSIRELVKDVPTLRLFLKAGVGNGFSAFTAAFLSGRDRINALNFLGEEDVIEEIKLKDYGFDVVYFSKTQLTDFWEFFKEHCGLVCSLEYVEARKE